MKLEKTAIFGLSTLRHDTSTNPSWFSDFIQQGIIPAFRVEYVCEKCKALGYTLECKHRAYRRPNHLGQSEDAISRYFISSNQFQLEISGLASENDENICFPSRLLDRMFANPKVQLVRPSKTILISIDPSPGTDVGKSTSDFAIVSITGPTIIILGGDVTESVHFEEQLTLLDEHIANIKKIEGCANSTLVFDIESNGNNIWSAFTNHIRRRYKNVAFLSDGKQKEATITTASMKLDCVRQTLINLENNDIHIHEKFASLNPTAVLDKLEKQLRQYQRFIKPNIDPSKPNHISFHGKGHSKREKDDLCFTLLRAVRSLTRYNADSIKKYFNKI